MSHMHIYTFHEKSLCATQNGDDLLAGRKSYHVMMELAPEMKHKVFTKDGWIDVQGARANVPMFPIDFEEVVELENLNDQSMKRYLLISKTPEGFLVGAMVSYIPI